jgi:hypothetical protein
MKKTTSPCERCGKMITSEYKWCLPCRRIIFKQWQEEGYLQKVSYGHAGDGRSGEAKENTYETKHGTGH